ncbi:MAG: hypothetical protein EOM59_12345 [Clostridia bacterium]|nr:hypothetical protein [Clostridia bacterium]
MIAKKVLKCDCCSKNLLEPEKIGNLIIWQKILTDEIKFIYCCCSEKCNSKLFIRHKINNKDLVDGYEKISNLCNPVVYYSRIFSLFNDVKNNNLNDGDIFKKYMIILQSIYPYISRDLTEDEKQDAKRLGEFSADLGGLG